MAIAAKISSTELTDQVTDRFVDQYFEARLINAPGTTYTPGTTNDASFLGFEVTVGTGGYQRQIIRYVSGDVSNYSDDGVGLATKATIFAQDGSGTDIDFTHAALVWSSGNVITLDTPATQPTAAVDGTYTNLPVDVASAAGTGLTVDLVITNSGAALSDYSLTIVRPGSGYVASEVLGITEAVLLAAGAVASGAGPLGMSVSTVYAPTNAGNVLAVAQTSAATALAAGNEAIFYWNLKQFGFYSV